MSVFFGGFLGAICGCLAIGALCVIIGGSGHDDFPPHDKE